MENIITQVEEYMQYPAATRLDNFKFLSNLSEASVLICMYYI